MHTDARHLAKRHTIARHLRRKRWQRVVMIMSCIVLFCTVYALILPAVTQDAKGSTGANIFQVHGINENNANVNNQTFLFRGLNGSDGQKVHNYMSNASRTATWYVIQCVPLHPGAINEKLVVRSCSVKNYDQIAQAGYFDGGSGFILVIPTSVGALGFDYPDGKEDYVTVGFAYKERSGYRSDGFGFVHIADDTKAAKDNTNELHVVPAASTRDFIEINLYEYYDNINHFYDINNAHVGFQQDGGTTNVANLNTLGQYNFNFGNNITSDLRAGHATITEGGVGLNATVSSYNGQTFGAANLPLTGQVSKLIGANNRPMLTSGLSLDIFFPSNDYTPPGLSSPSTKKVNTQSIDGLFQYDPVTGEYSYNSRENHAQYNRANDTFTLYEEFITSNYMMYPFGNFLPFNDIVTQTKQASQIDREYLLEIAGEAALRHGRGQDVFTDADGREGEYSLLAQNLNQFIFLMDKRYGHTNWTGKDAVDSYFQLSTSLPSFDPPQIGGRDLMDRVYSIDFDEKTDFFFGMNIKMDFIQPKNGMTGTDHDKDGQGDYPMEYFFTGDDDVLIYIDGVLFLDLSGIHRHVGGKIDFKNGLVHYYALTPQTGDVSETPYRTETFEQVFRNAYAEGSAELTKALAGLNDIGTFNNYTTHNYNFYYMERGSGSGICRMNFNFPTIQKNAISVGKETTVADLDTDSLNELGVKDETYSFQINKVDANGNKTNELLIAPNTPYTVVDREGQAVSGNFVTDANGVFTLEDGQRATFSNISESAGQYYVRELMSEQTASRYNSVYVNGQVSARGGPITVGNNSYFAFDSPVADPSLGGMSFQYVNDYSYEVLMIEKNATYLPESLYDQQAQADNTFTMQVTVNGEALPVGTKYKLLSDADTIFTVHGINTFNQNMANQVFMFTKNDQGYRVRDYLTADSMSGEWYVLQCLGKGEHVVARDGQILNYAQLKQSGLMVNSKKNFILLIPTSLYPDGLPFGVGDSDSIEDYTVPVFDYHSDSGYNDQGFGKLHVLSGESNRKNVTTPGEVILKSGQVAVIEHLLVGSTYTVNETQHSSQGFTVSYTLNGQSVPLPSGTVENANHWISVTVNNAEKTTSSDLGILALEKLVDGAANGSEEFLFTLQAAELKGQTFPAYRNGATIAGGVTFDANGKATVSLRHNDKVRVVDLPKNTQVTVTETAPGFSTSIQENNVFTIHGVNTFNQNFKDQVFMFTYTESNKQLGEYLTDSDMNGKWYVIQCVPSGTRLVARDSSLRSYQELKTNGYYPPIPRR